MKISTLASIAVACASANALQFQWLDNFKNSVANQVEEIRPDAQSSKLLDRMRSIYGTTQESFQEHVGTWKDIESQFSEEAINKAIRQFDAKKKLASDKLSNKFRSDKFNQAQHVFDAHAAGFDVVESAKFSEYSMRVKKSNPEILGLDTVDQYTGYLDVNSLDKHFFYWFFESRNDPANDPIVLWLNGGPGCSSATGLFFELGPSSINATLQPVYNPYSWNSNASVIFLDQPVGVGYSYTGGEAISTSRAAAKDVFIFLEFFFQKFPQFLNNKFHISGESYAGHYIPAIATEILDNADRSFELSSILIGNGITDALIQNAAYKPMACGEGGYKAVLDEDTCDTLDAEYERCAVLEKICYAQESAFTCVPASLYCGRLLAPYEKTGLNPYDIRIPCGDNGGLCYEQMTYIDDYLNSEFVKNAVGANVDLFTSCDDTVFFNFAKSGDEGRPFQDDVASLLDRGLPVLIYAGDKDYICNWLGNHAWSDALEYSGHEQFEFAPLKPWYTAEKKLAGEVKNFEKFTFLRVYDAGHMVPFDQPAAALDLLNRWISGDYSYGT